MSEYELLLTALEPISHHDPGKGSGGNTLTFLRAPRIIANSSATVNPATYQHLIDEICEQHPMSQRIHEVVKNLPLVDFLGVVLTRVFIDAYNNYDGTGLFNGPGRYEMLDKRLEVTAVKSGTLFTLWSQLAKGLDVPTQTSGYDELLAPLFSLPRQVQNQVTVTLSANHRAIVTVARLWHSLNKKEDAAQIYTAEYDLSESPEVPNVTVINIPAISANSIRHQLVRAPAMLDFFNRIGLNPQHAGEGELTIAAENLFDSGSNIKSGAKMVSVPPEQMSKLLAMFGNGGVKESGSSEAARAFYLASKVRKHYPTLDLLGGVCNAFDLGESRLQVSVWLVCRENKSSLPREIAALPEAQLSAFDMLSDMTRTHQAYQDQGQMIYNYETLNPGVKIYVRLMLTPYTQPATEGALLSALRYYRDHNPVVGGQSARGHGHIDVAFLTALDGKALAAYEEYVTENAENLKAWLLDGSLGTGKPWVIK